MKHKLVVDSCCELIDRLKEGIHLKSIPFIMSLGEKEFIDDDSLNVDEFVEEMNQYPGQAKSACPSPDAFLDEFQGAEEIYAVTISSGLSGSYQSAVVAKELAEKQGNKVHVFDSKSASAGELLISLKIKELLEEGFLRQQIIEYVEEFIKGMKTLFVLENLDNLVKNGRMSRVLGSILKVLHIRTVFGADPEGQIEYVAKANGINMAIKKMLDLIEKYRPDTQGKTLVITHCNNEKQAFSLKKLAEQRFSFKEILLVKTKGLSSMYANRGGIIIAF